MILAYYLLLARKGTGLTRVTPKHNIDLKQTSTFHSINNIKTFLSSNPKGTFPIPKDP